MGTSHIPVERGDTLWAATYSPARGDRPSVLEVYGRPCRRVGPKTLTVDGRLGGSDVFSRVPLDTLDAEPDLVAFSTYGERLYRTGDGALRGLVRHRAAATDAAEARVEEARSNAVRAVREFADLIERARAYIPNLEESR